VKNFIYGHHPVAEAIEAGTSIEKILLRKGYKPERIMRLANEAKLPVQFVPEIKLDKLSRNGAHQGVAAFVSAIVYHKLEETILSLQEKEESPLFVMLDGVTDVRNFGAIARTAECLGVHALIVPKQGGAAANGDAVKTSAGALHHISVCREENLVDSLMLLQAYGIPSFACTEKAQESIYDTDFSGPCCLIMGAEDKGISTSLIKRAEKLVKIPLYGQVSSLNVSVATALVLGEAVRQRRMG
jgi:23S rRNA (guanosine2251-2'-O)-methyltransferase